MNNLYSCTIPVFTKSLTALDALLGKAQTFVTEKNLDEAAFLESRLAADMFPLKRQVQIACDNAKGGAARLTGSEAPVHADEEKTLAELRARITKTIEFISTIKESAFEGAAERHITLSYFPGKYMTGAEYVQEHLIANFFFHLVTTYAILRKEGLPIGKADYIMGLPLKDEV